MIDIRVLEKRQDYKKLKKSFIIFICNYDPYGKFRYIYTFRNRCDEDFEVLLKDEATKIVINTKGNVGDIGDDLKAVIKYMDTGVASTEYTKALDAEVESVKSDEKVRMQYMWLMEAYARERKLGESQRVVRQVRRKINDLSIADMADLFDISLRECNSIVTMIAEHPDWDDEQIADQVDWED